MSIEIRQLMVKSSIVSDAADDNDVEQEDTDVHQCGQEGEKKQRKREWREWTLERESERWER